MGKKNQRSTRSRSKSRREEPRPQKDLKRVLPMILAMAALLVTGGISYFRAKPEPPIECDRLRAAVIPGKMMESKPTLDPERFYGTVRKAYAIAREIPEVLDQLYCYCRCRENINHLNLLSCYTDKHAST